MKVHSKSKQQGFSLIELIVVLAIMAIIAGAAVPITGTVITRKAIMATEEEQAHIVTAVGQYFADTEQMPSSIGDLLVAPSGVVGWTGPYFELISTDRISGMMVQQVDGWSRPYSVTIAGDLWTVSSSGPDATAGNADDVSNQVDVTFLRREVTIHRLKILNQAIVQYNGAWLETDPLPALWGTAFDQLVARGYLPNDPLLRVDGWGDAFLENPIGSLPVVQVSSSNMP